jgi:hypothetical protein
MGLLTSLLLAGGTALAVHDAGLFELDGNAVSANATPPADDWDRVCHEVTITNDTTSSIPDECASATDSSAGAVSWSAELNPSASIFTGGGSKDPIDVSSWAWKDAGGLPDKDNLLHAFAARYQQAPSTDCPAGTATTCDILYFGSDRFDNSGDAQQGFWFFQNKITLSNTKSGGGFAFNGVHKNGDVLIISDFSNGGTVSTISVYKWNSAVSGNLQLLLSSTAANCATAAAGDAACGLVNGSNGTASPWSFTDKSGFHTFLQGELYEGGINLSTLGLSDECFSSVAAETRSSTSTTATLKDFVLGQFAVCTPNLTTQASSNAPSTVLPGEEVHDTATIAISGGANATDPTGNVTFYLCGPIASGDCGTSGGTQVGSPVALVGGTPNDGTATAQSADVNTNADPLAPGRYCFRATWPGDSTYPVALNATNDTTECFLVQDTSSITTAQSWLPQDSATVTLASGGTPDGTVVFSLYENGTCSGTAARTFTDTDGSDGFKTGNTTYYTTSKIISWSATFTSNDSGVNGSTTTRCERSDLTINNSASDFPPAP